MKMNEMKKSVITLDSYGNRYEATAYYNADKTYVVYVADLDSMGHVEYFGVKPELDLDPFMRCSGCGGYIEWSRNLSEEERELIGEVTLDFGRPCWVSLQRGDAPRRPVALGHKCFGTKRLFNVRPQKGGEILVGLRNTGKGALTNWWAYAELTEEPGGIY